MKLNKRSRLGLVLCAYLIRSSVSNISNISSNLNVSVDFLAQIANDLRKAGILRSVRGPGGGFTIVDKDVSVFRILQALNTSPVITSSDADSMSVGGTEQRSIGKFLSHINFQLFSLLDVPISSVVDDMVIDEVAQLNSLDDTLVN